MDPAPEISGGQVDSVKGGFTVTLMGTDVVILGMTVHSRELQRGFVVILERPTETVLLNFIVFMFCFCLCLI